MCQHWKSWPWRRILVATGGAVLWGVVPQVVRAIHEASIISIKSGDPLYLEQVATFVDVCHALTEPINHSLALSEAFYAIWTAAIYVQLAVFSLWALRVHLTGHAPHVAVQLLVLLVFSGITNLLMGLPASRDRVQPEAVGVQMWFALVVQRADSYVSARLGWCCVVLHTLCRRRWVAWSITLQLVLYVLSTRQLYTPGVVNSVLLAWLLMQRPWRHMLNAYVQSATTSRRPRTSQPTEMFDIPVEDGVVSEDDLPLHGADEEEDDDDGPGPVDNAGRREAGALAVAVAESLP